MMMTINNSKNKHMKIHMMSLKNVVAIISQSTRMREKMMINKDQIDEIEVEVEAEGVEEAREVEEEKTSCLENHENKSTKRATFSSFIRMTRCSLNGSFLKRLLLMSSEFAQKMKIKMKNG